MAGKDEASLSLFYDRYHALVFALALRIVGLRPAAEEVVIEVFQQVWQRCGDYNQERGKVLTWLMTITRTRAIDHRRKLIKQHQVVQPIEEDPSVAQTAADPGDDAFELERRRRIRESLHSLPEPQRKALELAYFYGMSQSEIAEALKEPLGTIKTRIRSALAALRSELISYM